MARQTEGARGSPSYNSCRRFATRNTRRAFSLVEVLIAIALTGILLSALTLVTFNILGVWTDQAEDPLFDRHVDGLRRALEECTAETTDGSTGATNTGTGAVATGQTQRQQQASSVFTAAPSDVGVDRAPFLLITGAPPFIQGDTQPLGFVYGWLKLDTDGLVLHWQTLNERTENPDATHRLLLSPWVTEMLFVAYDAVNDTWQDVDANDPATVPSGASVFMQLNLNHRGQIREIRLPLSDAAPHNLNY